MKDKILRFGKWAEENHMTLIYLAGAIVLLLLLLWSFSILAGFWLSAIFDMSFQLNVGVSGIATIATAGATVYGIARAAQAKYSTDSQYNSAAGVKPHEGSNLK